MKKCVTLSPIYFPDSGTALTCDHINLSRYATADVLNAAMFQELAEKLIEEQREEHANDGFFTYSEVKLAGIYFADSIEGTGAAHKNELHIILTFDRFYHEELNFHMCVTLTFFDLMVLDEGNIALLYEDGEIESHYLTPEEYLANIDGDYRIINLE